MLFDTSTLKSGQLSSTDGTQVIPVPITNINDLLLSAANTILHNPLLVHPFVDREINVDVPQASTSPNTPFTVYDYAVGGQYGARLSSVSISVDAIFQANYYWTMFIDGVTGPNGKNFQPFDPTVNTFEAVPTAEFYYLKPQAHVTITAYNQSGISNDGHMSVFVSADQMTQGQQTIFNNYNAMLDALAAQA